MYDLNPKNNKICSDIKAVNIIYDTKIKLDARVKFLNTYISGLSYKMESSKQKETDLLNAKNEYLKKQTIDCQNRLE